MPLDVHGHKTFYLSVHCRIGELESALLIDDCDFGIIRNISMVQPLPADLRADVWQVSLFYAKLIVVIPDTGPT